MDGSDWPQTKPYRPSNGTEGAMFEERFCDRCKRDATYRRSEGMRGGCRILMLVGAYQLHEPQYPKEWVQNAHGDPYSATARCTAFRHEDEPPRPRRPRPAPLLDLMTA